jgi:single-strand DNA-binding protein
MSYHDVTLVGALGRDPEMRYTPSGKAVTNFSVAVDDSYTDSNGQRVKRVIWPRISTWGKQAEACNQYLHKGSKVLVVGRLVHDENGNPRTFTRQDGTPGAAFEITAQTVRFLSSKGEVTGEANADAPAEAPVEEPVEEVEF